MYVSSLVFVVVLGFFFNLICLLFDVATGTTGAVIMSFLYTLALLRMFQMKRWCQCWKTESSDKGRRRYLCKTWITT